MSSTARTVPEYESSPDRVVALVASVQAQGIPKDPRARANITTDRQPGEGRKDESLRVSPPYLRCQRRPIVLRHVSLMLCTARCSVQGGG